MDFINQSITWLEQNWGVTMFGTVSLGAVVTTVWLLVKQWVANKVQGTKYENLFRSSQDQFNKMADLYKAEKEKNAQINVQNIFMQQSQAVLMDAIIKMALSSKLDGDDKVAIVANVERLKLMTPVEIVETVKEKTESIVTNVQQELTANPAQTVLNITNSVSSLLDKYTTKKEV